MPHKQPFRVKEFPVDRPTKVIFLFTAMGTKISLYRPAVALLNRHGYSCVVYDYPIKAVLRGDLTEWQRLYRNIIDDGQARVRHYKQHGVMHCYAYGVSMGTLIANKFTRDTPEISHVIFNLTYGDIAQNIWTYRRVKPAKKSLIKQGLTEDTLRKHVQYADPIFNAEGLRGKKVLLHLSRSDKVLVYTQTRFTRQAFETAELDFTYIENRYLGHYLAGAKNMLSIKTIDKFYASSVKASGKGLLKTEAK